MHRIENVIVSLSNPHTEVLPMAYGPVFDAAIAGLVVPYVRENSYN